MDESMLVLDANSSYDPQAEADETTNIPIECVWECPSAFHDVCDSDSIIVENNGCTLSIPSLTILESA